MVDSTGFENLKLIREETRFEHQQIAERITWFVAVQAFLITPYALTFTNPQSELQIFRSVIPLAGIGLSILILLAVVPAAIRIREHRTKESELQEHSPLKWGRDDRRAIAVLVPQLIPLGSLTVWLSLIIRSWSGLGYLTYVGLVICVISLFCVVELRFAREMQKNKHPARKSADNDA